ncbi:MAG TPA: SPOR domain-containing protein [Candidatus Binatia bacterium]|nr:SPOR domain-containing protein [Candidatus Binatia bacterium]
MPWQNNGDYYSFKQDSITQHAPSVSGVYGLFNSRHQIVIGSAANIRDALLHHRRHTQFRFSRFEPSGYTFEICPAERRESRAQELIKEYSPISSPDTSIGIATLYRSWRAPNARAFKAEVTRENKPASNKKIVAIATRVPRAKQKAPLHLNVERFGLAGALCGTVFLAIGLVGIVPHLKSLFEVVVRNPMASAESGRQIAGSKMQQAQAAPPIAAESVGRRSVTTPSNAVGNSAPVTVPPNTEVVSNSPTGWRSAAAQASTAAPAASSTPATEASKQAVTRQVPANGWSVQAMASTDKKEANDWLQKLKAKGYEAYLVDAAIKGKTWHRVRIGTFEARQDAEHLRAELKAKEGYGDAYVTGYDKPPDTIALNRR